MSLTLFSSLKSIITAKVNIDTRDGMEIAKAEKVLDEGIPNVRLYKKTAGTSTSLMSGNLLPAKKIISIIRVEVNGMGRRDDGFFLKG